MTERLPKPLQDKFVALAFDLEAKSQHFPTLTKSFDFVNKHTSIANHPVSGKPQNFSYNNPLRNKRELPNGKSDLLKFTMSISNHGKQSVQPSLPPQKNVKGKSNNCCCCGQAHPLYRCEEFKRKTPRERRSLVSSKKLCPNCLKDTEHSTDTCPSSFRCRIEGCGAFHHSHLHPKGKIGVVFDAAAKFHGTSLNDQLLQGPDYINNLAGVLMRFRQEEVVLVTDREQMFHQVRVPVEDCYALRFLWWSGDLNDEPAEYQMLVHIFGATSSPCCSNKALRQTADEHEDKYDSEAAETVRRNFYVDDLLKSVQTTDQATALAVKLTAMLKKVASI